MAQPNIQVGVFGLRDTAAGAHNEDAVDQVVFGRTVVKTAGDVLLRAFHQFGRWLKAVDAAGRVFAAVARQRGVVNMEQQWNQVEQDALTFLQGGAGAQQTLGVQLQKTLANIGDALPANAALKERLRSVFCRHKSL